MQTSDLVTQGHQALRQGEQDRATQLFEAALEQNSENVTAWLGLARVAKTQKQRLAYIQRAERIAPEDPKVQKAKQWAMSKETTNNVSGDSKMFNWKVFRIGCSGAAIILILFVGVLFWATSFNGNQVQENEQLTLADVGTELNVSSGSVVRDVANDTAVSDQNSNVAATSTPQLPEKNVALQDPRPTWTITPTPLPTATPTPTFAPTFVSDIYDRAERPIGVGLDEKWIDVNLTTQTLTAYEGDSPVFQRAISSGTWEYPTVTGQFRIWLTYESQTMDGTLLGFDYYLEDVPYVMYFYGDYAIHGTFWHNNFGTPTSHGCVNMSREDAGWLYSWAGLGTLVNVHH